VIDSTGRSTSKGKPTLTKKKKRGDIQATTKVVDFRSLKSSPPKIQFIFPIFSNNRFLKAIYFWSNQDANRSSGVGLGRGVLESPLLFQSRFAFKQAAQSCHTQINEFQRLCVHSVEMTALVKRIAFRQSLPACPLKKT